MRYARELLSPVAFAMRRPKSVKKDMERGLQAPEASKACNRSEGLVAMHGCAWFAAAHTSEAVMDIISMGIKGQKCPFWYQFHI